MENSYNDSTSTFKFKEIINTLMGDNFCDSLLAFYKPNPFNKKGVYYKRQEFVSKKLMFLF